MLVPPGYGEDVKSWPTASILPPEPVKESPRVFKVDTNTTNTEEFRANKRWLLVWGTYSLGSVVLVIYLLAKYPVY